MNKDEWRFKECGNSKCCCQCGSTTPLQCQIVTASNELDRLATMLDDEMKRKDVLDMCDILAKLGVE